MSSLDVIERVARAIRHSIENSPHNFGEAGIVLSYQESACAAIAEFLAATREPSEAMFAAGGTAEPFAGPGAGWTPGQIIAGTVWREMHAAIAREMGIEP